MRIGTLRAMTDCITHRGPDAEGTWLAEESPLALGHRRLAVIDLTESGQQPMASATGRWIIVFNGEIYNYRMLRVRLAQAGARFLGSSDTEVLLVAIEAWGLKRALQEAVGMFAFGLWDRHERKLHLVRDRIGEKPLYYAQFGQSFAFASELKALRSHPHWIGQIDRNALTLYLRHAYVPAPYSIYAGVRKVLPGTMLTVSLGDSPPQLSQTTYWSALDAVCSQSKSRFDAPDELILDDLESRLSSTIADQMVSDVPLGAFLSGGTDSSLIVALMQRQSTTPIRTFTIGFHDKQFDEADYARAVAAHLGTSHTEYFVSPSEAREVIPLLPYLYDEPFGDSSQIPTYLVARLARQHVTVALSGDGGDEIFGGYDRYSVAIRTWYRLSRTPLMLRLALSSLLSAIPERLWSSLLRAGAPMAPALRLHSPDKIGKLSRFLRIESRDHLYRYLASAWDNPAAVVIGGFEDSIPFGALGQEVALEDYREQMMLIDLLSYLPDDIMVKVDRAAMGVSLETRAPFLDHRIIEFASSLPLSFRVRDGNTKWALKQLLRRLIPPELVDRPKMGFSIPLGDWLRGPLREWAESLLSTERLQFEGFFEPRIVRDVWTDHLSGQSYWTGKLWPILMFQAWLKHQAHPHSPTPKYCVEEDSRSR